MEHVLQFEIFTNLLHCHNVPLLETSLAKSLSLDSDLPTQQIEKMHRIANLEVVGNHGYFESLLPLKVYLSRAERCREALLVKYKIQSCFKHSRKQYQEWRHNQSQKQYAKNI